MVKPFLRAIRFYALIRFSLNYGSVGTVIAAQISFHRQKRSMTTNDYYFAVGFHVSVDIIRAN